MGFIPVIISALEAKEKAAQQQVAQAQSPQWQMPNPYGPQLGGPQGGGGGGRGGGGNPNSVTGMLMRYVAKRFLNGGAQNGQVTQGDTGIPVTVPGQGPIPVEPAGQGGTGEPSQGPGGGSPTPDSTPEEPVSTGPTAGLQDIGDVADSLAQGRIVTKPMIARIGEKGPEAVVPLTPRPGNRLQPDILEAHVSAPKIPGIKYSRYKGFNRFGPGQGGEI